MRIEFKVNKYLPNADTLATIGELPMATSNPKLTETKVNYHRAGTRGITIVEEKAVDVNRLEFVWMYLIKKMSIKDIAEEKTGHKYTFSHTLTK